MEQEPPWERWARLFYWAAALACPALLLTSRYPWLIDYPDWVYQGHIAHLKLFAGAALPQYAWKGYPVPNALVTWVLMLLESFASPVAAGRILVALLLLGFAVLLPAAAGWRQPGARYSRALLGLATLALASPFWSGNIGYQFGLLLLLAYVVLDLAGRANPPATAALGILIFFTHAVPLVGFILHVALRNFRRRGAGSWLALLPCLALLAWYGAARMAPGAPVEQAAPPPPIADASIARLAAWKAYSAFKLGPFQGFLMPDGRSFLERVPWLYAALVAGNILFMLAWLWLGLRGSGARAASRAGGGAAEAPGAGEREERDLRRFGWLMFLAFLPMPFQLFAVVNIGERILRLGMVAQLPRIRIPRPALAGLVLLAAAGIGVDVAFLAYARTQPIPRESQDLLQAGTSEDFVNRVMPRTRQRFFNHKVFQGEEFYRGLEGGGLNLRCFSSGVFSFVPMGDSGTSAAAATAAGPSRRTP